VGILKLGGGGNQLCRHECSRGGDLGREETHTGRTGCSLSRGGWGGQDGRVEREVKKGKRLGEGGIWRRSSVEWGK